MAGAGTDHGGSGEDASVRTRVRAMATGMMVALAACGDDATQPGGEPAAQTFTASVTGGLTRALTGGAHFGRAADGRSESVV